jgi:endonuclease G
LDFTVVRIDIPTNHTFGHISLEATGPADPCSRCYIIGHPKGRPKEVSLQKNVIVEVIDKKYIHYTADTEKGSSGSPVFNDKWQLIALHHSGGKRKYDIRTDERIWHTNEGILIELITKKLPPHFAL